MVSSLATKIHKTLHSVETDETMVWFPFPLNEITSSNCVTAIYRSLSFQQILTDSHASKSSLWVNEIGVVWIGRNGWGNLFLILGLRRRKAVVKLSGRILTHWCFVLPLICIFIDILWLYHVLSGSFWFYFKRKLYESLRFRRSASQEWSTQKLQRSGLQSKKIDAVSFHSSLTCFHFLLPIAAVFMCAAFLFMITTLTYIIA